MRRKCEDLPRAVGTNGFDSHVIGCQWHVFGRANTPAGRHAIFEDFEREHAMTSVDRARLIAMVMMVAVSLLVPPRSPQHPECNAKDENGGDYLQIGLGRFRVPLCAKVQTRKRDDPDNRGMGGGRGKS